MKQYLYVYTVLFFVFINLTAFSQKSSWVIYDKDSVISVKHRHKYDDYAEQLDSLIFNYNGKTFNFPNQKEYSKKEELITKYQDSLSMPYDFQLPVITRIIDYSDTKIIVIGNSRRIEKIFMSDLHIIILDKETFNIDCWITTHTMRGTYDALFFFNEKRWL